MDIETFTRDRDLPEYTPGKRITLVDLTNRLLDRIRGRYRTTPGRPRRGTLTLSDLSRKTAIDLRLLRRLMHGGSVSSRKFDTLLWGMGWGIMDLLRNEELEAEITKRRAPKPPVYKTLIPHPGMRKNRAKTP